MALADKDLRATNLPLRVFLYTLDQIEVMLNIEVKNLEKTYLYFVGRSVGIAYAWKIKAVNIAPPDEKPEWRVADKELIRWLKNRGFRVLERGYVKN